MIEKSEQKQLRYDKAYLRMADTWAELSHCARKKVGAIIVKDDAIISDGYNGTPAGFDNSCETGDGETHWYVLHAEANAITKLAKSTISSEGSTLYVTLSPCLGCAKLIIQAGIRRIVFNEMYRNTDAFDLFRMAGIEIVQIILNKTK